MIKLASAIMLSLALSGCGGGLLSNIGDIAREDIRAAHASAVAYNDPLAVQCWAWLETVIPDAPITEVKGVATAYQKARNIRRAIQLRDTDAFKLNCGPMLMDSRSVITGLLF